MMFSPSASTAVTSLFSIFTNHSIQPFISQLLLCIPSHFKAEHLDYFHIFILSIDTNGKSYWRRLISECKYLHKNTFVVGHFIDITERNIRAADARARCFYISAGGYSMNHSHYRVSPQ